VAIFGPDRVHPWRLKQILRRDLAGSNDPENPTGEWRVLAALNRNDIEDVRRALTTEPRDPLLRPDFVAWMTAELSVDPDSEFVPYSLHIPKRIWHAAAKRGRLDHRSFRDVLKDYLVRGWEESTAQHAEARNARKALSQQLKRYSALLEDTLAAPREGGAGGPRLEAVEKAVGELRADVADTHRTTTNALAALLVAFDQRKWLAPEIRKQLKADGWPLP
jgi:hypothetical protein